MFIDNERSVCARVERLKVVGEGEGGELDGAGEGNSRRLWRRRKKEGGGERKREKSRGAEGENCFIFWETKFFRKWESFSPDLGFKCFLSSTISLRRGL